jgi:predicted nucleotidyltransferase
MLPVRRIMLFGSKARGDDDPESDVDLLVLTARPVPMEERWAVNRRILPVECQRGVMISLLLIPEEEWEHGMMQAHPIRTEVRRDGVEV